MVTADHGRPLLVSLLGPVRAWRGNRELDLGGPQRQAVLGLLALRANQAVARSELIDGIWVRPSEVRLTAIEERAEIMLMLGRAAATATELTGLVREHPLREALRGQLMLALYRCGRQADALATFADGRLVLVEELGLEPGPGLQRLHEQILAADPALGPLAVTVTLAGPRARH
jgi:DNA-binding SARP family transcriptional activator